MSDEKSSRHGFSQFWKFSRSFSESCKSSHFLNSPEEIFCWHVAPHTELEEDWLTTLVLWALLSLRNALAVLYLQILTRAKFQAVGMLYPASLLLTPAASHWPSRTRRWRLICCIWSQWHCFFYSRNFFHALTPLGAHSLNKTHTFLELTSKVETEIT